MPRVDAFGWLEVVTGGCGGLDSDWGRVWGGWMSCSKDGLRRLAPGVLFRLLGGAQILFHIVELNGKLHPLVSHLHPPSTMREPLEISTYTARTVRARLDELLLQCSCLPSQLERLLQCGYILHEPSHFLQCAAEANSSTVGCSAMPGVR